MSPIFETFLFDQSTECIANFNTAQILQIRKAHEFMCDAHHGQIRRTGEPFAVHPEIIARIMFALHAPCVTIIQALLHDVVEDTHRDLNSIEENFGADVAAGVEALTKTQFLYENHGSYVEKIRSYTTIDHWLGILKLADRSHNLATRHALPYEKQVNLLLQTEAHYLPLARQFKLNDLAVWFSQLTPANSEKSQTPSVSSHQIALDLASKFTLSKHG